MCVGMNKHYEADYMARLLTVTQRENNSVNATNSINECVSCEKWTKEANTGGIVSMPPMGKVRKCPLGCL